MVLLLFHMETSLPLLPLLTPSPSWEPQRRRKGMKGEERERKERWGRRGEERKNKTTTLLLLVFVMSLWLKSRLSEQKHIRLKNVWTRTRVRLCPVLRLSGYKEATARPFDWWRSYLQPRPRAGRNWTDQITGLVWSPKLSLRLFSFHCTIDCFPLT